MPGMETMYGSLKIKNPLVVASAGTSEHLELIKKAEDMSAAAVVMKTLFEEEYTRKNPTPCYSIIKRKGGPMHSSTFYSFEQASPWDLERYAEEVRRAAKDVSIPVIASINCVSDPAWADYASCLEEAGAAALEINRSCPFSKVMLEGKDTWTAAAIETVKLVKDKVSIPVCAKFTPQLTDPLLTAVSLDKAGADGLVMFSRFTGLDIDLEKEAPIMHGGIAGHGGPWAIHYALRWISAAAPQVNIPISGSGGVSCGEDIIKYILAGASSVQICTSLYMEGFTVIADYLKKLDYYMTEKGYTDIEQFRGAVCSRIIPPDQVNRTRARVARIDEDSCTNCGICEKVCLHQSAFTGGENAYIVQQDCVGCGLCAELCPQSAINMTGI